VTKDVMSDTCLLIILLHLHLNIAIIICFELSMSIVNLKTFQMIRPDLRDFQSTKDWLGTLIGQMTAAILISKATSSLRLCSKYGG
jgi:hypothetical protein